MHARRFFTTSGKLSPQGSPQSYPVASVASLPSASSTTIRRISIGILILVALIVLDYTVTNMIFRPSKLLKKAPPASSWTLDDFATNSTNNRLFDTVWVILGAPVTEQATPGPEMQERLDHVIRKYHHQNKKKLHDGTSSSSSSSSSQLGIVLTGGAPQTYGSSGVAPEALVMARYLVDKGKIPRDILVVEAHAQHTFHNALYTKQLFVFHGDGQQQQQPLPPSYTISVVTHDWHMQRSLWCFQIVWSDQPGIVIQAETVVTTVPSSSSDTTTKSLEAKYKSEHAVLQRGWIPQCIQQEASSRSMPPVSVAMAKWKELSSSLSTTPGASVHRV
jgi:DUF218 domain